MIKKTEFRNLYDIMKLVIIGNVMIWIVWRIPCLLSNYNKICVHKSNLRDKIWFNFSCYWHISNNLSTVNMCKPLNLPGTQEVNCSQV